MALVGVEVVTFFFVFFFFTNVLSAKSDRSTVLCQQAIGLHSQVNPVVDQSKRRGHRKRRDKQCAEPKLYNYGRLIFFFNEADVG